MRMRCRIRRPPTTSRCGVLARARAYSPDIAHLWRIQLLQLLRASYRYMAHIDSGVEWLIPLCISMRAKDDVPPECCSTSSAALLTARPHVQT